MTEPAKLTIRRPDDWHVHLRDGEMLKQVVGHTARQFGRAIVMPNLTPPVITAADAAAYRERVLAAIGPDADFTPLMTAYLTDSTDADDLASGFADGVFTAVKLYPAHATTNSQFGVTDIFALYPVLERMQEIGMPLLIHGESTDPEVDIFDREAVFLERTFKKLVNDLPGLKMVLEHVTTKDAVDFVTAAPDNVAATVTPHHLRINRNAMFEGGIRPHFYCLPIAKREDHRVHLRAAATSGNPKFFLGTDSAPHTLGKKIAACGCAGIFNAPYALESYAETFEEERALDKLEAFASEFGARFYGLPLNTGTVTLERKANVGLARFGIGEDELTPFHAGQNLSWRFAD